MNTRQKFVGKYVISWVSLFLRYLQLLIISKRSIALLVSVNDPDTLNDANSDYSVETLLRLAQERMNGCRRC